jgi:diguanylate cyclase (GGDEF)-like protein
MGQVAGLLYLVGTVTTVLGIVFPHSPQADVAGFWVLAAVMAATSLALFSLRKRLPRSAYLVVIGLGSAIVSLAVYFNGERHGGRAADNEVLYLWIALYAGYFFTRAQIVGQLVVVAACYAATLLAIAPGQVGFTRWFITVSMVSVAAGVVHTLTRRNDRLMSELFDAARTDMLTGLLNRQGFDERFELELARARRTGEPLALVLADIDSFKELNDRDGHPAGDAALRAVGARAREVMRHTDIVARIGGDELAAILPDADIRVAFAIAERLRNAVAELEGISSQPLTMSFGVAAYPEHGRSCEMLVLTADRALYRAKGLGRNCSVADGLDAPRPPRPGDARMPRQRASTRRRPRARSSGRVSKP